MADVNRAQDPAAQQPVAKKAYTPPTLTECGSVAKLTMAKGSTTSELGQIVRRAPGCL